MEKEAIDKFIESWGNMGSVWGINNSMAKVHALLIVSEGPISLDHIAKRLKISRGNASMCLKELRNWTVIRKVKIPGDRKDYYISEPDIWTMFFAIIRERKKREVTPIIKALREVISQVDDSSENEVANRLMQMEEFIATMDSIFERFLNNEQAARQVINFLVSSEIKKD
jgi:HTH-type transcriptional regulator, glycine betaine synthesis regulator